MAYLSLGVVVLVACHTPGESKGPELTDSDSGPEHTGSADTDTGTLDSGDTADTGDTHETGDSGDSDTAVVEPPCDRSLPWKYVAAGWFSTCGVHTDGCAECWGIGKEEDYPDWDTGAYQYRGEDLPPEGDYVAIEMITSSPYDFFGQHACGILSSGDVMCWGDNSDGEATSQAGAFVDLALWAAGSSAIGSDGNVWSWGLNLNRSDGPYSAIATGGRYTYALRGDGTLDGTDLIGDIDRDEPAGQFISVDVEDYACAVHVDGSLLCWDPADPADAETEWLTLTAPEGVFEQVCMTRDAEACALDTTGFAQCWGNSEIPGLTPTTTEFTQIACGSAHICGLTPSGEIICWGWDYYGETLVPT